MPTYLDSGRSHHSHEADWVAFGGGGAAAQAAVAKRCPGPEPETTAARRREQPPSRSGGGSTGARKASQLGRQMERVISGFQNIFEFEQKISFFQ